MSTHPIASGRGAPYSTLDEEHGVEGVSMDTLGEGTQHKAAAPSRRRLYTILGVVAALLAVAAIIVIAVKVSKSTHTGADDDLDDGVDHEGVYQVADPTYVRKLDIAPRLQWNENYGYCGSTSMICSNLYFGGYISQYDNRLIASNGTNQKQEGSQLLLGVNDYWVAHQHKLTNELWDSSKTDIKKFIAWIKGHILQGHPVIIGIFENPTVFGNSPPDDEYDHIVPVTGWGSNKPLTDTSYYADDVIYFSDNGLYTPSKNTPVFDISATVSVFAQSRKNANKKTAAPYSVNGAPSKSSPNYGIAITGIVDINGDCLPTALTTPQDRETPEIVDGSNTRPSSMSMTMTATASGLTKGTQYIMYQYNSMDTVPSDKFNANADNAYATFAFTATDTTYSKTVTIKSSDYAIFRTVLASAP